ncbi:MAG: entericidin [Muribaculaceae bacterium]|nr:entericidin [Muribaculaceae bacterium]
MKKLVLMLAVVASVSLFSCGNAEKAAENADTTAVVETEAVVEETACAKCDSCTNDSCAQDSCAKCECAAEATTEAAAE